MQAREASAPPPAKRQRADGNADKEVVFVTCRDTDIAAIKTIVGEYTEKGENHGRKIFQRTLTTPSSGSPVNVLIYFWDARHGNNYQGWWFGNKLGGTQVWAHAASLTDKPPKIGWKVPWDGQVQPKLQVLNKTEKVQLDRKIELESLTEEVQSVKAEALQVWRSMGQTQTKEGLSLSRLSEVESHLAAHLITAEGICGRLTELGTSMLEDNEDVHMSRSFSKTQAAAKGLQAGLSTELEKVRERRNNMELEILTVEARNRDTEVLAKLLKEMQEGLVRVDRAIKGASAAMLEAPPKEGDAIRIKEEEAEADDQGMKEEPRGEEDPDQMQGNEHREEGKNKDQDEAKSKEVAIEEVHKENEVPEEAEDHNDRQGEQTRIIDNNDSLEEVKGGRRDKELKDADMLEKEQDVQEHREVQERAASPPRDPLKRVEIKQEAADAGGSSGVHDMQVEENDGFEHECQKVEFRCKLQEDAAESGREEAEQAVTAAAMALARLKEMLHQGFQKSGGFEGSVRDLAMSELAKIETVADGKEEVLAPYEAMRLRWRKEKVARQDASSMSEQGNKLAMLLRAAKKALDALGDELQDEEVAAASQDVHSADVQHTDLSSKFQQKYVEPSTKEALDKVHMPGRLAAAAGVLQLLKAQCCAAGQLLKAKQALREVSEKVAVASAAVEALERQRQALDEAFAALAWRPALPDEVAKHEAEIHNLQGTLVSTKVAMQKKILEVRRYSSKECQAALQSFQTSQEELEALVPKLARLKEAAEELRRSVLMREVEEKVAGVEEDSARAAALLLVLGADVIMQQPIEAVSEALVKRSILEQEALKDARVAKEFVAAKQIEVKQRRGSSWEASMPLVKCMMRLTSAQTQLAARLEASAGAADRLARRRELLDWTTKCSFAEDRVTALEGALESMPSLPTLPTVAADLGKDMAIAIPAVPLGRFKEAEHAFNQATLHIKFVSNPASLEKLDALAAVMEESVAGVHSRVQEVRHRLDVAAAKLQDQKAALAAAPVLKAAWQDLNECQNKFKAAQASQLAHSNGPGSREDCGGAGGLTASAATASLRRSKALMSVKLHTMKRLPGAFGEQATSLVASCLAAVEEMMQNLAAAQHKGKAVSFVATARS